MTIAHWHAPCFLPSAIHDEGPRPAPPPSPTRRRGHSLMDLNRFTEKAQEAILASRSLAARGGQQTIEPEHLLLALQEQDGGVANAMLQKAGANVAALRERATQAVGRLPKVSGGGDPHPGSRLNRVALKAEDEAKALKDEYVA